LQPSQRRYKSGTPHNSEEDKEQSDDDDDHHPLVHESLQKEKKPNRAGAKTKFVPADETAERRDQRTIFIGNLSVEVAQKRVSPQYGQRLSKPLSYTLFSHS
jgi:nucleolar protein 12